MKNIKLSQRMLALCALLEKTNKVADIGCDHAHVAIYLVQEQIADSVIAMDIGKGPLKRAQENIKEYGLTDYIETRLSDGAEKLSPYETNACIIAGMGGLLMKKILLDSMEVFRNMDQMVLQPQSELREFREFLAENAFEIINENMVLEEGKFYPMMRVVPVDKPYSLNQAQATYGPLLLSKKHPVLRQFLEYEYKKKREILSSFEKNNDLSLVSDRVKARIETINQEILLNEQCSAQMGEA